MYSFEVQAQFSETALPAMGRSVSSRLILRPSLGSSTIAIRNRSEICLLILLLVGACSGYLTRRRAPGWTPPKKPGGWAFRDYMSGTNVYDSSEAS